MSNIPQLDDPIGAGLRSAHERFAVLHGSASRYRPDVSPFCSVGLDPGEESWASLRELVGSSSALLFMDAGFEPPAGWRTTLRLPLTQMVHDGVVPERPAGEIAVRPLTAADVPQMLSLVTATQPGPFAESTIELGGYLGIFDGDQLVAMAGRRMSPPSFVEVSAVCTDPDYRGRGYAARLMIDVMHGIRQEGSRSFLHVAHGNPARSLYEHLGFVARREFDAVMIEPT